MSRPKLVLATQEQDGLRYDLVVDRIDPIVISGMGADSLTLKPTVVVSRADDFDDALTNAVREQLGR